MAVVSSMLYDNLYFTITGSIKSALRCSTAQQRITTPCYALREWFLIEQIVITWEWWRPGLSLD